MIDFRLFLNLKTESPLLGGFFRGWILYQLEEWQRARACLDRKTSATDCRNDLPDPLHCKLGIFWNGRK